MVKQKKPCYTDEYTGMGVASRTYIPFFKIPKALHAVLKKENDTVCNTQLGQHYAELLKNLPNIGQLTPANYFFMLKVFLFIEQYYVYKDSQKRNLTDQTIKLAENLQFEISVKNLDPDDPFVKLDDFVKLEDSENQGSCICKVVEISNNIVTVMAYDNFAGQNFLQGYKREKKYKVKFRYSNWTTNCCHYALYLAYKVNLTDVLHPTNVSTLKQPEQELKWFNKEIKGNKEQRQAVNCVLNKTAYPAPYIIFGPPGTGKTATLVEIICQIWYNNPSDHVLICTASNTAADEITKRLLKNSIPPRDIHRMYAPSTAHEKLPGEFDAVANFVDGKAILLPKKLIETKRIVVTTIMSSIRLQALKLRRCHFSYLIVDEASQALEAEMLIPITVLSHSIHKENKSKIHGQIVLAGDPCQLGPIVKSPLIQHLYGKSMMERLMEHKPYQKGKKYNPNYITKLLKNYRSHCDILRLPNKLFYKNELQISAGPRSNIALDWLELPNKQFPLIFHNVNGTEERDDNSPSVYNMDEVRVVIHYLKKILSDEFYKEKIGQKNIGIVTPYKKQQSMIKSELKNIGFSEIPVGTVELFQGQEKDVIILSTVRTETIGFLYNPKRFNVAITRAIALLIIIGNEALLKTDRHWNAIIRYCKENRACKNCSKSTVA